MSAKRFKQVNNFKNLIRASNEEDIKKIIANKGNAALALHGIAHSYFQKDILDKLFTKDVFNVFLDNIELSTALKDLNFYKLINSYRTDKYVTAKLYHSDIYELISVINGGYIFYMFLSLLFSDRRGYVPKQYKPILLEEFSYYGHIYKYWQYLNGKITLTDSEMLEIINDKFKTDFQKISHIILKKHLFDPKIVEFAVQLGYAPHSSEKVYSVVKIIPADYVTGRGVDTTITEVSEGVYNIEGHYIYAKFLFNKPTSFKAKFFLEVPADSDLTVYSDKDVDEYKYHNKLKSGRINEVEFYNVKQVIFDCFLWDDGVKLPIKIKNLTFYPIWV